MRRSCETWIGDVKVLWCFFGPFCLSGDTFGSHFARLGKPWGLMFDLLGPLGALGRSFGLSWAKLAHDNEKSQFFEFKFLIWASSWYQKSRKIDAQNHVFFRCVFDIDFYRFFIAFGLKIGMVF